MPAPLQGTFRQTGIAKEPAWGTLTAATTADQFPPVGNAKFEEMYDPIVDDNNRSRISKTQGWQQGFRSSKYSFETHCYPDVIGNILMGMYGTDGWTAGSTHPFSVFNGGLPASYTIQDFYGIAGTHTRSMTGMYVETITITGADKGPMKASVTYAGGKFSTLVAKPTAVYTTALPFLFWNCVCTLNSIVSTKLQSWTLNLKRAVAPIPAAGAQDPSASNSADFECTGKMIFQPTDDTEYLLYVTAQQAAFPLVMAFTNGATTMTHTMTKTQFESPTTFDAGPYVKCSVSFLGLDNATDGGASATTIVGGKSGAAY